MIRVRVRMSCNSSEVRYAPAQSVTSVPMSARMTKPAIRMMMIVTPVAKRRG